MATVGGVADLRVGLVGYGLGGSVFHAPLVDATAGLRLEAIVTADAGRRAAAGDRYPDARVLGSVTELLAQAGELDLVVVTVPNARHAEVAQAAMEAGLHVVVDKPVAPAASTVRSLASVAERAGLSLVPYHNRRWDGDFLTARALLDEGRLGEPWRLESRFERWRPGSPPGRSWKQDPAVAGGGVLMDLGPHLVDQALVLFGRPDRVYAEVVARGGGPVDDDAFVALGYDGGPSVHLWASSRSAHLGPRLRLLGSESAYVKYGMDPQEDDLRAGRRPDGPGGPTEWGREAPERWGRVVAGGSEEVVESSPGAYQRFYELMVDHLRDGAPAPVDVADAVAGMEVIEAALASAASGSAVALSG